MFPLLALIGLSFGVSLVIEFSGESDEDSDEIQEGRTEISEEDLEKTDLGELIEFDQIESDVDPSDSGVSIKPTDLDEAFLETRNLKEGTDGPDILNGADDGPTDILDLIFGGEGDDFVTGGASDILIGGGGQDVFEVQGNGEVFILDFGDDEDIIVRYTGAAPDITGDGTDDGISILANGYPIVHLEGVYEFDFSKISLLPFGEQLN